MPKKYLLNLSGHPAPQKKVDGRVVVSVPVVANLVADPQKLFDELFDVTKRIWESLDDDIKKSLAAGLTAIVPPGHPAIASFVLAFIHAISGHFPKVYIWVRSDEGFRLVGPLDLQNVREWWRLNRPYYIK